MNFIPAASGGYQQITDCSSAVGLTIPAGCKSAMIQAEAKNVRWRADGTAPDANTGNILYAGDPPTLFGNSGGAQGLAALQFIEVQASATLNITYLN